jgi:stalled ribosome rescue protein Dom34
MRIIMQDKLDGGLFMKPEAQDMLWHLLMNL